MFFSLDYTPVHREKFIKERKNRTFSNAVFCDENIPFYCGFITALITPDARYHFPNRTTDTEESVTLPDTVPESAPLLSSSTSYSPLNV